MKEYELIFDPPARTDAKEAAEYIAEDSPEQARRWLAELENAVNSLRLLPGRCGYAREHRRSSRLPVRQYIFYSHRVVFEVDDDAATVRILRVIHSARRSR